MSILIKSMEKPEKCCYCPLTRYYYENGRLWCNACNRIIAELPYEDRLLDSALEQIDVPDFCPLVEVKVPHGRLVDIDEVENMLDNAATISDGEYSGYCWEDIKLREIPTIIEEEI